MGSIWQYGGCGMSTGRLRQIVWLGIITISVSKHKLVFLKLFSIYCRLRFIIIYGVICSNDAFNRIRIETNETNSILNVTHVIILPQVLSAIRFHSRFNQSFLAPLIIVAITAWSQLFKVCFDGVYFVHLANWQKKTFVYI